MRNSMMARRLGGGRRLAAIMGLLLLPGCGMFGGGAPEPPPPVCERIDLPARALVGVMLRQPERSSSVEVLPVEGSATRGGAVRRLEADERTVRVRAREADGRFTGWRGERGVPVPGISDGDSAVARQLSYRQDGVRFTATTVYGNPSPGMRIPTSGRARYQGPVRLELSGGSERVVLTGTARFTVGFGSGQVEADFVGLMPGSGTVERPGPGAAVMGGAGEGGEQRASGAAIATLVWTNLGICAAQIGSTGQGGVRAYDSAGAPAALAGAAILHATLYGGDAVAGVPEELGGVLVIESDDGALSGVFLARRDG